MKIYCPQCGNENKVISQEDKYRPDEPVIQSTCWNEGCKLFRFTIALKSLLDEENMKRYKIDYKFNPITGKKKK